MSKGHIRLRGPGAWELKYDAARIRPAGNGSLDTRQSAVQSETHSAKCARN